MRRMALILALALFAAGGCGALAQGGGDKRQGSGDEDVVKDGDSRTPPVIAAPDGDSRSADSPYFTLEVCNRDRRKAYVAIGSRDNPATKDWYVAGWWGVLPGDCQNLGRYPKSVIYLHAEDSRGGQWRGRDQRLCVEKQRFKRINFAGYKCSGNLLRGFFAKKITADRYIWNLNP